jgi:hypothetical protein
MSAGSKPILMVERPQSVPALQSYLVVGVAVGAKSWSLSGDTLSRTQYEIDSTDFEAKCQTPLSLHTRYEIARRRPAATGRLALDRSRPDTRSVQLPNPRTPTQTS